MGDDKVLPFVRPEGPGPAGDGTQPPVMPPGPGDGGSPPADPPSSDPAVDETLPAAVEALLFAAGEPVTLTELVAALDGAEPAAVREVLHALSANLQGRGVQLVRTSGAWQLRTDPRFSDAVLRLRGGRPQRMSRSAVETLAVVAYRQPVIRSEIDDVRGVNSGGVLKTLLDKGYLRVMGRRDQPGRPLEYGTTRLFLEMFSLDRLADLPTLKEREALAEQQEPELELPRALLDEAEALLAGREHDAVVAPALDLLEPGGHTDLARDAGEE